MVDPFQSSIALHDCFLHETENRIEPHGCRSGVFIVNSEHNLLLVPVFLWLILRRQMLDGMAFKLKNLNMDMTSKIFGHRI